MREREPRELRFRALYLGLDIIDGVGRFEFNGSGLPNQHLDKDLHASTEAEDKMKSRFLLNVTLQKGATIFRFKLFAGEDEVLLVWWDTFLVLDIVDSVGGFNFEDNSLVSQGLHEDLHTTTKAEDEVKSGFRLNIIVGERVRPSSNCIPGEDETLLVRRNTLF